MAAVAELSLAPFAAEQGPFRSEAVAPEDQSTTEAFLAAVPFDLTASSPTDQPSVKLLISAHLSPDSGYTAERLDIIGGE